MRVRCDVSSRKAHDHRRALCWLPPDPSARSARGFGQAFEADRDGERYALKILHAELLESVEREQFRREVRALAKFEHPNLVDLADSGVEHVAGRDYWWIAMPYLKGRTLASEIEASGGRIAPSRARELARQVAEGLAVLHAGSVVHRDLKPANIFVTEEGVVKLLDFGLARFLDYSSLTERGQVRGTLFYAAPEQLRGETEPSIDLWALGVVLYEMLTGRRPFGGADVVALIAAIGEEIPEPPSAFAPELSSDRDLEELVLCLLEKEAMNRPPSADEIAAALRPVLAAASLTKPEAYDRALEPRVYMRVGSRDVDDFVNASLHGDAPTGVVSGITDRSGLAPARKAAAMQGIEFGVDPLLLRLALSNFTKTNELRRTGYAPDGLSPWRPEQLRDVDQSARLARAVLQEQINCGASMLFSAHFFFRDLDDMWLRRNTKLLDDSLAARDVIAPERPLVALVAGSLAPLCSEEALISLVNRLRRGRPDAFWLMLDSIQPPGTEAELVFPLRLALLLQDLGVPAVLARAGTLRYFFLACGVGGVEVGLGRSTRFAMSDFQSRGAGHKPPLFEFPSLLHALPPEKATAVLSSGEVDESDCGCAACLGRSIEQRIAATAEHNAAMLRRQRKSLAGVAPADRILRLRDGINRAGAIGRRLRRLAAMNDQLEHLRAWSRALDEVEHSKLLEPGRAARRAS